MQPTATNQKRNRRIPKRSNRRMGASKNGQTILPMTVRTMKRRTIKYKTFRQHNNNIQCKLERLRAKKLPLSQAQQLRLKLKRITKRLKNRIRKPRKAPNSRKCLLSSKPVRLILLRPRLLKLLLSERQAKVATSLRPRRERSMKRNSIG